MARVRPVERPLPLSLRSLARHVDAERFVQEGLLRMWRLAPTLALPGHDASLRRTRRLVRNLASNEARKQQRFVAPEDEDLPPEGREAAFERTLAARRLVAMLDGEGLSSTARVVLARARNLTQSC